MALHFACFLLHILHDIKGGEGKLGCGFVSVRGVAFMQDQVVNGVCCPTKKLGRLIGGKPFVHS